MRLLLTNDDGIHAEGLAALERLASEFGEVTTVAPDRDRSAIGQAISLTRPLRLKRHAERRWALDGGTPTDCVYVGLHHVLAGELPDLVLSGINPGPNLGWDVLYSGTVAAAREAVLQGVPGIAFSMLGSSQGFPYEEAFEVIRQAIRLAIECPPPEHTFLNVNLPNPRIGPIHGLEATCLGHRYYSKEVEVRRDPRGGEYLWIGGRDVFMPDIPGSDCNAVRAGWASVTALGCDSTHSGHAAALATRLRPKDHP